MNAFRRMLFGCLTLAMCASEAPSAAPLGTGFTYQGQLNQSGSPVSGTAHFRFSLWSAAAGGTQIGTSQIVNNVLVTGGIFTVQLNGGNQFTSVPFDGGDACWLQVEVCTDGTCSSTTVLSPRQALTGTPFALEALQSETLLNFDGGVIAELYPGTTTNSPGIFAGRLHHDMLLGSYLEGSASHGFISTGYASVAPRKISIGRASSSDFNSAVFEPLLTVQSTNGNVGIGTPTPTEMLDVRGNIRMGGNGQLYAASGEENLRIIRGCINGPDVIECGSGFTISSGANYEWTITFNQPFASTPSVTATSRDCIPTCLERFAEITVVTPSYVKIQQYYRGSGNYVSGPLDFIAVGPR